MGNPQSYLASSRYDGVDTRRRTILGNRATIAAVAIVILSAFGSAATAIAGIETGFEDVDDDSTFAAPIAWLRVSGASRGCNPPLNSQYCAKEPVTRGQMAAILSRTLRLPDSEQDWFVDDGASVFEADINRIAAAHITMGCNPPANDHYCPNEPVTRGQMAAFVVRAFELPPASSHAGFDDIDSSVFADSIRRMASAQVTLGCNPPTNDRYCPDELMTRGQMAAFIWRAQSRPALGAPTRIVAVGDVARCELDTDEQTAALADEAFRNTNGAVAILGDAVYDDGSSEQFADCYAPSWGRHRFRTLPAVGNHEYRTAGASGYFDFFGPAAGDPTQGWYEYSVGEWQVVVLNSNCDEISGCHAGSEQESWLRNRLAAADSQCTLAYMHHPRFSSGHHGDNSALTDLWRALVEHDVDVALAGHDHNYERLGPLDTNGDPSSPGGVPSFVVGTGGTWLRPVGSPRPGSEVVIDDSHGVLILDLEPSGYSWQFVDTNGRVQDGGARPCS